MPAASPDLRLTHHAIKRGRERLHLNEGSLRRMAMHAMTKGMPMAEAHGEMFSWLELNVRRHGKGGQTCIRDGAVYVIEEGVLITVLILPAEYRSQVQKWLARNGPAAKPSGNLKDPQSGVVTPKTSRESSKRVSNALKSPVWRRTRPAKGHPWEEEES